MLFRFDLRGLNWIALSIERKREENIAVLTVHCSRIGILVTCATCQCCVVHCALCIQSCCLVFIVFKIDFKSIAQPPSTAWWIRATAVNALRLGAQLVRYGADDRH